MQIDAEIHFWKYGKTIRHPIISTHKILQEDYLPEQITLSFSRNSIDACIAVSSEPAEVETRFLAELAATHPILAGVIGWIDLYDSKAVEKINEFQQYPSIRGYQTDTVKIQNISGAVIDALTKQEYVLELSLSPGTDIQALNKCLSTYPDQNFILQHCGNPYSKLSPAAEWEMNIRNLAKNRNLFCKVSGLFTGANTKSWKPVDFYPFLEIIFDSFGIERLLFASDWPFMLIAGLYVQWKSLLEKFTEKYTTEDRDKFFGENARQLYRI